MLEPGDLAGSDPTVRSGKWFPNTLRGTAREWCAGEMLGKRWRKVSNKPPKHYKCEPLDL